MKATTTLFTAAAVLAAVLAAGCGDRGQVTVYKQGKYQGKPDSRPWDNDPGPAPHMGSTWTRGDKASWEAALKARTLSQNEYLRSE